MPLIIFLVLFTFLNPTQAASRDILFDHQHSAWSKILKKYTRSKNAQVYINYQALQKDQESLDQYLKRLTLVRVKDFKTFSSKEQLSFLINAYNAFSIRLVIDHYPVKSVKDIGGALSSPWGKKNFSLLGEKRTLDDLEHRLIRKKFYNAKIYFVLNNTSVGAPSLFREAIIPMKMEQQFDQAAGRFLRNKNKNYYNAKEDVLYISKIFKWHKGDFIRDFKGVGKFIAPHLKVDYVTGQRMRKGKVKIKYTNYDWSLNEYRSAKASKI